MSEVCRTTYEVYYKRFSKLLANISSKSRKMFQQPVPVPERRQQQKENEALPRLLARLRASDMMKGPPWLDDFPGSAAVARFCVAALHVFMVVQFWLLNSRAGQVEGLEVIMRTAGGLWLAMLSAKSCRCSNRLLNKIGLHPWENG